MEHCAQRDRQTIMQRNTVSFDDGLLITNLSVNDIIRECYRQAYFTGNLSDVLLSDSDAAMTMTTSVQRTGTSKLPRAPRMQASTVGVLLNSGAGGFVADGSHVGLEYAAAPLDDEVTTTATSSATSGGITQMGDSRDTSNAHVAAEQSGPTATSSQNHDNAATVSHQTFNLADRHPGESITTDGRVDPLQQRFHVAANLKPASELTAENFHLNSQYPLYEEFDPNNAPSFIFDPFEGSHFDAYDISDLSWNNFIDYNAHA